MIDFILYQKQVKKDIEQIFDWLGVTASGVLSRWCASI